MLANAPGCEKASHRAAHRLCDLFAVSPVSQQRDMLVNLEMHMSESSEVIMIDCYTKNDGHSIKVIFFLVR